MVEYLKKSLEGLTPPGCPNCHTQMHWYRSERDRDDVTAVVHFFVCSHCNRISETRAVTSAGKPAPATRLSHPPEHSRASSG
jgi:hypothetical protein